MLRYHTSGQDRAGQGRVVQYPHQSMYKYKCFVLTLSSYKFNLAGIISLSLSR